MKLDALINGISILETHHWDPHRKISKVTSDSRSVEPGDLFVACPGERMDGQDFVTQAIYAGASAILFERQPDCTIPKNVIAIQVHNARESLALLLQNFYQHPERKLKVIGITGTNGKTTTAYMLYRLLSDKEKAAYIGTLAYEFAGKRIQAPNTTPGPEVLIPLMAEMVEAGIKYCFMEVSSHSISQNRILGIPFEVAVFTQLTQDHLDYHKTMERYYQSKRAFFSSLPAPKQILINRDCMYGRRLLDEFLQAKSFSMQTLADYKVSNVHCSLQGSRFTYHYQGRNSSFQIRLPMEHNVSNTLAVLSVLHLLGYDPEDFKGTLQEFHGVPGRLERVIGSEDIEIFVDYAHTPDAFEHVLGEAHKLKKKRIVTLFGCGGDRDQAKRPLMAKIAAQYSDVLILTSDNPRSEDPLKILKDMKRGILLSEHKPEIYEILDRRKAIEKALWIAEPGDVLFVLGKGHEDYQILGEKKIPFDDRAVIQECLKRKSRVLFP